MSSSLRRTDVLTLAHLRNDGRKPNEIRRIKVQMGVMTTHTSACSGSASVNMGLTSVLATVYGPSECPRRSEELPHRAILSVSVRAAPYAQSLSDRRAVNPQTDKRLLETGQCIRGALEAATLLHLYPRCKIEVQIYVLADDGGRLPCAINAACAALIDAGIAMKDVVCACSAGLLHPDDSQNALPLVDLNKAELMGGGGDGGAVYVPCATLPQRGTIVMSQCESSRMHLETYQKVLQAAVDGCDAVFEVMALAVRERSATILAAKHGNADVVLRSDVKPM